MNICEVHFYGEVITTRSPSELAPFFNESLCTVTTEDVETEVMRTRDGLGDKRSEYIDFVVNYADKDRYDGHSIVYGFHGVILDKGEAVAREILSGLSVLLSTHKIIHRIEVYGEVGADDVSNEMIAYYHYNWPEGQGETSLT